MNPVKGQSKVTTRINDRRCIIFRYGSATLVSPRKADVRSAIAVSKIAAKCSQHRGGEKQIVDARFHGEAILDGEFSSNGADRCVQQTEGQLFVGCGLMAPSQDLL